jgi:hypothetical protein
MQTKLSTILKLSLMSFVIIFFTSCTTTKKVRFNDSVVVPGAEGEVKVKKDNNGNYHLDIEIQNLADSKKLTPSKNTYVVWIETKESGSKNIGQVHSSSALFSKAKKASIETVSPTKPTRIFVTAEDDPAVEFPGPQIVLTTETFN